MKFAKVFFVFLAMICGARAFGTSYASTALEAKTITSSTSHSPLTTDLQSQATQLKVEAPEISVSNSNDGVLKQTHHSSPTKFRQLAHTKRGKNRVLFTQDFQVPCRTAFITTLIPEEPTDLSVLTTQNSLSIPESLQILFNEDCYTIASRV
jgi:hypothetical protein